MPRKPFFWSKTLIFALLPSQVQWSIFWKFIIVQSIDSPLKFVTTQIPRVIRGWSRLTWCRMKWNILTIVTWSFYSSFSNLSVCKFYCYIGTYSDVNNVRKCWKKVFNFKTSIQQFFQKCFVHNNFHEGCMTKFFFFKQCKLLSKQLKFP